MRYRRMIISDLEREGESEEEMMLWLCKSIGILEGKGDETAAEIFEELTKGTMKGTGTTTSFLCKKTKITRAAVIYHINKFGMQGLVRKSGCRYFLRRSSLKGTFEEVEGEMTRIMRKIINLAEELDRLER